MIYIIILNWNGATNTIACLNSLEKIKAPRFKVLVCDNGSTDDSWLRLKSYQLHNHVLNIELIQTGANLGFAGGNNVGLKIALSDPAMDYIWLLNNDTLVTRDSLAALCRYMIKHSTVGICGSTLLYLDEPNRIQAVGGKYNRWLGTSTHLLGYVCYSETICHSINPVEMDYIVGASMFVRRSVLEQVGLLSEDYFLYSEEIDWTTRMKRLMPSMTLGYASDSLVYHKEGASTQSGGRVKKYQYFSDYFFITSRLKFSRKFYPLQSLVVQASMLLVAFRRFRSGQPRSAVVALCCFLGWIPTWLDPRHKINL